MTNKVFFAPIKDSSTEDIVCNKINQLYKAVGVKQLVTRNALVALKIHFGEKGGPGHINPKFARQVVDYVKASGGKPFLTDTNTLYVGARSNAVDHLTLAAEHGFSLTKMGAPIIIADGLRGENQISIKNPPASIQPMVHLAGLARASDVIISLTHVTGHMLSGYAGNIKNIAMGLSARGGKLGQHSETLIPKINHKKCQVCGTCEEYCPTHAIYMENDQTIIEADKCCGCGECFAVCPHRAIDIKWTETPERFQQKMAEYCSAVLKDKKAVFFNFALRVTSQCDCMSKPSAPITPDLGILASLDPVAVDAATIDLLNQNAGTDIFKKHYPNINYMTQLDHAVQIKLGSKDYELETV